MTTLLTLSVIRHRLLNVCIQMSMKIGNRSTSAMNRKAIYTQRQYIHKGSKKTTEID